MTKHLIVIILALCLIAVGVPQAQAATGIFKSSALLAIIPTVFVIIMIPIVGTIQAIKGNQEPQKDTPDKPDQNGAANNAPAQQQTPEQETR